MANRIKLIFILLMTTVVLLAQYKKNVFTDYSTLKKGVIDNAGNILVPPIYDEIEPSPLDIFAGKKDGKTLLFNGDGTIRVPLIYQHINPNLNGFTNQKGFAAVTKNDKERNSWGIIKNDGKVIVPEKYAYVHVVNEKLFVGRIDGEKKLDFFNEKGENIGSLDGRKIQSPSLDDTCFGLEGIDRKVIFYTSDLKPVTPDNPKLGYWTNGKGTILESKEEGGINRKGMVDKGGKTIIPFEFQSFKKGLDDQFICVKNNKNYNDSLFVVFDNKGKKIIPEGQYSITLFGDIYLVRSLTSDVFQIYTKDGKKLLPGQFLGTPIKLAENYHREMADHKKYDYIELKKSINGKKYILHKSGKYLDLNGINEYSYFSDSYPLIFGAKDQETNSNKYFLVDMNGKKMIDQSFNYIKHTAFPQIFFVKKVHNSRVQIFNIKTNKLDPEKYEEAIWMLNDYYILKKDKKYILLDKNMNEKYISEKRIIQPTKDDYLAFYKENVLRESMIAKIDDYNKSGIFTAIKENGETVIVDFSKYFKEFEEYNKTTKLETRGESFKVLPKEEIKELEKTENKKPTLDTIINDEIAINLEQLPSFPGGEKALLDFINTHLKYPPVAKENGVQGKVIIECVVEKDGTLTSCFINKNLNGGCGKEALRVVNLFPKMIPGKVKGESVKSKYTLPIDFILE